MSRRTDKAAERAASEASEAARTLAQRGAEVRKSQEPAPEPSPEPKAEVVRASEPGRVEKLLKGRPHSQAMDEILAKREGPEEPEKEPETPAEEPKAEAPATTEAPAQEEPAAAPEVHAEPAGPKVIKVKVDGEEFDVPEADIEDAGGLRAYRIQRAAENRLQKANEALAAIREAQAEALKPKASPESQVSDEQFIAERMDKVRFGTPEEAAKAQLEINQRTNKPVDQNALIEAAVNRINHDQAVRAFDSEYKDLVADPLLVNWIVAERNRRLSQIKGPVDWQNFYRTIGSEIRTRLGRQSQPATSSAPAAGTPSQQSEKEARKASITTIPTAAARAALPKEEKELSPEEERKAWIADQKKARGLG